MNPTALHQITIAKRALCGSARQHRLRCDTGHAQLCEMAAVGLGSVEERLAKHDRAIALAKALLLVAKRMDNDLSAQGHGYMLDRVPGWEGSDLLEAGQHFLDNIDN